MAPVKQDDLAPLSLIVNVLDSHEMVRRQLLYMNGIMPAHSELILVDDGSEPSLEAVCAATRKTYNFTLHCTNDQRAWTQPAARNAGARLACHDRLLFFDIDHILTGDVLYRAATMTCTKLHWYREAAALDERGNLVIAPYILLNKYGVSSGRRSVHENSFCITREAFDALNGYDEKCCGQYGGDDLDFNARYNEMCGFDSRFMPSVVAGLGFVFSPPDYQTHFHKLPRHRRKPPSININ